MNELNYENAIEISNLTKRYDGFTLNDVSFNVPKGSTLAILGRTGSGKTTVANLLLHMYNVEDGMISFDGRDINEIPL